MSNHKEYRFHVDVDDTYDNVHALFKYSSVEIEFWHSFVPPHKVVYKIGPLSEIGIINWEQKFKDIGAKFTVTERDTRKCTSPDGCHCGGDLPRIQQQCSWWK